MDDTGFVKLDEFGNVVSWHGYLKHTIIYYMFRTSLGPVSQSLEAARPIIELIVSVNYAEMIISYSFALTNYILPPPLMWVVEMTDRSRINPVSVRHGLVLIHCISHLPTFHKDVIKWKHFPRYWPFVRGIHRWPVDSSHKSQWRGALVFFFDLRLNKQQWRRRWFETPSRSLSRYGYVACLRSHVSMVQLADWKKKHRT